MQSRISLLQDDRGNLIANTSATTRTIQGNHKNKETVPVDVSIPKLYNNKNVVYIYFFSQYNLSLNIFLYICIYNYVTFDINTLKSTLSRSIIKLNSPLSLFSFFFFLLFYTVSISLRIETRDLHSIVFVTIRIL